jgi:hypothetical protein
MLAAYKKHLQERIDVAFAAQDRGFNFARAAQGRSGRASWLLIVVLDDGTFAAVKDDLDRSMREQPLLTGVALRALSEIADHPAPFSPELVKEVGHRFLYNARFGPL